MDFQPNSKWLFESHFAKETVHLGNFTNIQRDPNFTNIQRVPNFTSIQRVPNFTIYSGTQTLQIYSGTQTSQIYSGTQTLQVYSGSQTLQIYSGSQTLQIYRGSQTLQIYRGSQTNSIIRRPLLDQRYDFKKAKEHKTRKLRSIHRPISHNKLYFKVIGKLFALKQICFINVVFYI